MALSSKRKGILAVFGAFIFGAVVGITLFYLLVRKANHTWAWVALAVANEYRNAGDDDRAILVLSQATAKDPDFFGPYNLLGDMYAKKGNRRFALEMYREALAVFDRERFLPPGRIQKEEEDSIRAKISVFEKELNNQPKK